MSELRGRRVGRPSEVVLSRKRIFEVALRLLDTHGPEGFGMRDVARELGVRVSSLYNHIDSKDDILRGIRELIGERISGEMLESADWYAGLRDWAYAYREAFAAHPPTIALLAVMPIHVDSNVSIAYNRVISLLHTAGWTRAEAINTLVALESFILGSALDAVAAPDMLNPGDRDDVPAFTTAYHEREEVVTRTGITPADLAFRTGLDLFLGGLRAQEQARGSSEAGTR